MNAIKQACEILGSQRALATVLGVTPGAVNQWITGYRPFPVEHCINIEVATGGKVRCEQLRPDMNWAALRATDCPVTEREAA